MSFVAVLSRESLPIRVGGTLPGAATVASAGSPERLLRLVRERPVTAAVVDSAALDEGASVEGLLHELKRLFPSLGVVLVSRPGLAPRVLLRLGRAGIAGFALVGGGELGTGLPRALARARRGDTRSRVLRALGAAVASGERACIGLALDGVPAGWGADELADRVGWTRAHLGVLLRRSGLPTPGRLLLWARLLHAAHWLTDPGRSAESVSRQLDYANGATFRRAIRNYLGTTPTELVEKGGLTWVLDRFLDECGVGGSLGP